MDTTRSDVSETAKSESSDQLSSLRDECRVGVSLSCVSRVGGKLVGDDLGGDQSRDGKDIGRWDTEQEGERVQDVSTDEFDRERVGTGSSDTPELTDPSEQTVDGVKHGHDDQHIAEDESSDSETKPCTVGEGVEEVGAVVL